MNATSSAVNWVPSWNFTPCRILNVHTEPSSLGFQLSASRGWSWSFSSDQHRYSPLWQSTASPPESATRSGSSAAAGVMTPVLIVPPGLGGACAAGVEAGSSPAPHPAAMKLTSGMDMPITLPRRMSSAREILPALSSSTRWFSTCDRLRRISSRRR